jgi:hypothetical protein
MIPRGALKPAAVHELISQYHNGNIPRIIQAANDWGDHVITNVGHLSPTSINTAFRFLEVQRQMATVILTSPKFKNAIRDFGDGITDTHEKRVWAWSAEVIAFPDPELEKALVVLPKRNEGSQSIVLIEVICDEDLRRLNNS